MSVKNEATAEAVKEEHELEEKYPLEVEHKLQHENKELKEATSSACEEAQPEAREQWSQKFDFLMSIIGFSVDLAGIWRL